MAANSLLYLLLTTQLTSPPDQALTTESNYDVSTRQPYDVTDDHADWRYKDNGRPQDARIDWPGYQAKEHGDQYTSPPITEGTDGNCPDGEVWDRCTGHCQLTCKNGGNVACPKICVPGCLCAKGSLRGDDGKCIPASQCPSREGADTEEPYEVTDEYILSRYKTKEPSYVTDEYSHWHQETEEPRYVTDEYGNWRQETEEPRYVTKEHGPWHQETEEPRYVTDEYGNWRQETQKPSYQYPAPTVTAGAGKDCPAGEVYDDCEGHCQRTCENGGKVVICPRICLPGCLCAKGTLRAENGKCVEASECPSTEGHTEKPYEVTEEHSQWKIDWRNKDNAKPRDSRVFWQYPGAETEEPGHQYTAPPITENQDEVTTSSYDAQTRRPIQPLATEEPDHETKESEARSRKDHQKRTCPPREHKSRHKDCEKTCDNYLNPKPCPRKGKKGCVCDGGLVRNKEGKCVARDQCPKSAENCPSGEVWDQCRFNCQLTCKNKRQGRMICPFDCTPGCLCVEGTVRGDDGKCIKPSQCPSSREEVTTSSYDAQTRRPIQPLATEEPEHETREPGQWSWPHATEEPEHETEEPEDRLRKHKILGSSHGCPDNNACRKYCQSTGRRSGGCVAMSRMACICFE